MFILKGHCEEPLDFAQDQLCDEAISHRSRSKDENCFAAPLLLLLRNKIVTIHFFDPPHPSPLPSGRGNLQSTDGRENARCFCLHAERRALGDSEIKLSNHARHSCQPVISKCLLLTAWLNDADRSKVRGIVASA